MWTREIEWDVPICSRSVRGGDDDGRAMVERSQRSRLSFGENRIVSTGMTGAFRNSIGAGGRERTS